MGASVHPTAIIGENVKLGQDVVIEAGTIVRDNVTIGDGTYVGPFCVIGEWLRDYHRNRPQYKHLPTIIGAGCIIRSHSVIYAGTEIGDNVETGSRVFIREISSIGSRVTIGTSTELMGHCKIGSGTRIHSSVFIPEHTTIGRNVRIFPYVVLTNDIHPPCGKCIRGPRIKDYAVLGAGCIVLPHVTVGKGAVVAAGAVVTKDVEDGILVAGCPSKKIKNAKEVVCKTNRNPNKRPYPWW